MKTKDTSGIKQEVEEIKIDDEPHSSKMEPSEGVRTRPGRRAARLAAEKIQKTVRKYGLFNDDDDDFDRGDDFDGGMDDDDDDEDYDQEKENETTIKKKTPPKPSPQKKEVIIVKRPLPPPPPPKPIAPRPKPVMPLTKIVPPHQINAETDIGLHMDCTEDALSQAQIAALKKSGEAYDTAMRLLREYRAAGARIIYSHDTVHASATLTLESTDLNEDGTTTTVVHTSPPATSTTTTVSIRDRNSVTIPIAPNAVAKPTPAILKPVSSPSAAVTIASSPNIVSQPLVVAAPQGVQLMRTVGNQQAFLVAASPVQGVPATAPPVATNSPLTYKVLIDSRTGVVVGTLPGDANLMTSPGTPVTRKVVGTTVPQKPVVTPDKRPSPVVTQAMATPAKPPPLHAGSLPQKTAEDQTKTAQQTTRNKSVPVITGGSKIVTAHSLLAVRLQTWKVKPDICLQKIDKLKKWLDGSKFTEEPIQWMIEHRLLPEAPTCSFCSKVKMDLVEDTTCFDGVKWHCPHPKCGKYHVVSRMSFFARFGVSMAKLLSLVYHWAIQSDIEKVMREINVDIYMIRSVWRAIQEVCARAVSLRSKKLGGQGVKVEVSRAQIGRFLVLAAFDRSSKETRLKVVSVTLGWNSVISQKCLESWLLPKTIVLSSDKRLTDLQKAGMNHIMVDPASHVGAGDAHLNNVKKYLEVKLNALFGDLVVHQLKLETIQGFLDELQWRERYSTDPSDAFWNILRDIAEQCGRRVLFGGGFEPPEESGDKTIKAEEITVNVDIPIVNIDDNDAPVDVPAAGGDVAEIKTEKKKTLKRKLSITSPPSSPQSSRGIKSGNTSDDDSDAVLVVLDEYYYATKDPNPSLLSKLVKSNYLFRCHICKKVLDNNVKAMKHISGHIENKRHKNLDLSDLTQCKYCYRDFETPYSMQCHMEQVHLKTNALACRICNQAFSQTSLLTKHMKSHHKQAEMPYSCQACEYRSSFQREILEHFQQEHSGTDKLLCHYCLKVYNVTFSKTLNIGFTQMFYYHLYKHQCKTVSRKCPQCCLVFLNLHDLRTHRIMDHESKKDEPGVHPMKATDPNPILVRDPQKTKKKGRPFGSSSSLGGRAGKSSPGGYRASSTSKQKISDIAPLEERYTEFALTTDTSALLCWECKGIIEDEHFAKFVSCGRCRYATNCCKAFVNHMICQHSDLDKKRTALVHLMPVRSLLPMICECGFTSVLGNMMASHMVSCGVPTCSVNFQGASDADLEMPMLEPFEADFLADPIALCQVEMEEQEEEKMDQSEPNSSTDTANSSTETASSEENTKPSEDRPDMLNALGLVRRKSNSDPPGTPTSADENSTSLQDLPPPVPTPSEEKPTTAT